MAERLRPLQSLTLFEAYGLTFLVVLVELDEQIRRRVGIIEERRNMEAEIAIMFFIIMVNYNRNNHAK